MKKVQSEQLKYSSREKRGKRLHCTQGRESQKRACSLGSIGPPFSLFMGIQFPGLKKFCEKLFHLAGFVRVSSIRIEPKKYVGIGMVLGIQIAD